MTSSPPPAARRLVLGEAVNGVAGVPLPHRYEVAVPAGHYLQVAVEQLGLDVAIRLLPPGEGRVLEIDSPTGVRGTERAHAVADAAALYTLEVDLAGDEAPEDGYRIEVAALRPASDTDRLRAEAEAALAVAEMRRRGEGSRADDYRAALALAERLGDDRLRAYNHYRLGDIALAAGSAEAEPHCRRSVAFARAAGETQLEAVAHNRLATSLLRAGRLEEALGEQETALELFRELGDTALAAETLSALGATFHLLARHPESLRAFEDSLALFRDAGDPPESAAARLGFGETLLSLGRLDEAAGQFRRAAEIAEPAGETGWAARAERGIGLVLSRRQDAGAAIPHFARALAHARRLGDDALSAVTLAELATAQLQLGEVEAARSGVDEALAISRRLGDVVYEASMLHKLAQCHHAAGEHAESARFHAEAADAFARLGDQVAVAGAQYGLARALHLAGDPRAGLAALEMALAAAEEVRRSVGGADLQASYLGSKGHYRELHVDLWMALHAGEPEAGHDLSALLADDRGRARSLLDLLAPDREADAAAAPELHAERERLLHSLARLRQIGERQRVEPDAAAALADVERRQGELLLRLERVRAELRRAAPASEAEPPRPLERVLDELVGDSLVLVYSLGERQGYLWALGPRGVRRSVVLPPRKEIDLLARRAVDGLSSPGAAGEGAAARALSELSRQLLAPVADELRRHRRVAVVADGGLRAVPFAALPDPAAPQRPLVAEHEVVAVPSLSVLDRLRRRGAPAEGWRGLAAVVADPVFAEGDPRLGGGEAMGGGQAAGGGEAGGEALPERLTRALGGAGARFSRLPGTRREAEALLRLLPEDAPVFRGFDFAADREAILGGALRGYRIVHIATHGVLDTGPAAAGLVFSLVDEAGRPRDGYLQLHEVYDLDLNAEVIVLSACQSGVGRDMEGEGLLGLTRGFLEAGAPRLVVSLWQVGDRGSAELMERFYRAWLFEGEPPSAALAVAQRSMWSEDEWSDPYHWAGFQFVGDWSVAESGEDRDRPIEKTNAGTPNQPPKPDDPLPGPDGGGKRRPPK